MSQTCGSRFSSPQRPADKKPRGSRPRAWSTPPENELIVGHYSGVPFRTWISSETSNIYLFFYDFITVYQRIESCQDVWLQTIHFWLYTLGKTILIYGKKWRIAFIIKCLIKKMFEIGVLVLRTISKLTFDSIPCSIIIQFDRKSIYYTFSFQYISCSINLPKTFTLIIIPQTKII